MKIHIDLPCGGSLDIERQPMSKDRATLFAGVILAAIGAVAFIKFFALMV